MSIPRYYVDERERPVHPRCTSSAVRARLHDGGSVNPPICWRCGCPATEKGNPVVPLEEIIEANRQGMATWIRSFAHGLVRRFEDDLTIDVVVTIGGKRFCFSEKMEVQHDPLEL